MEPRLDAIGIVTADHATSCRFYALLGVPVDPWDAFWGQRYARVLDPDGNAIDLFAPLEG